MKKFILLLLFTLNAVAGTNSLKDLNNDYFLKVNSDGSIELPPNACTETTLSSFATQNHTDLILVDSDLLSFKSANHIDVTATTSAVNSFATQNHLDISSAISAIQASEPRKLQDGVGNNITSQVNGSQRALDIGVNVSGVQIDPRARLVKTVSPTASVDGVYTVPVLGPYNIQGAMSEESLYALWGQMFSATTNNATLTGTTETPFLLIKNPNASGKNLKFYKFTFGPTLGNNYVTYRMYLNPTITANGTVITISGNRQTNQNASIAQFYSVPTTSANGTIFRSFTNAGVSGQDLPLNFNFSLWLEQNNNLLITRQLSANASIGGVDVEWAEQ